MKKLRATQFIKTRINKGNLVENYKFMFQTIHQAFKYRISMPIFFTAVNQLFSIFYQVIFRRTAGTAWSLCRDFSFASKILLRCLL